ncbi:hypothetical protein CRN61_17815 [Vibrio vulnificus]|uniref:hypothetical protein n=1 Tax=Vibrio vulnificus TaxID=672 RepID=UPI000C9EB01B|nr:hypothetical protein [Vibrio vulnificus]PNG65001.1 hypothetical protein SC81_07745 [Vibrio vulnificus]POC08134.1 hypothetical protein CRN54_16585 [Vibrio vulnificus]POC78049.1 hypothetical protein CRN61_17815 [Vibrio vulnificus]
MTFYSVGCDPDSKAHGVAIYKDGALIELLNLSLLDFMDKLLELKKLGDIRVHIENVNGNKAVWHGEEQNKKAYGMTSQNVAKCKQAQVEVERMLARLQVPFTHHQPSSAWKKEDQKRQFELVTGWKGRSNEDNRSAAYFGYLGAGGFKSALSFAKPYIQKGENKREIKRYSQSR